jgi:TPR repeat protein
MEVAMTATPLSDILLGPHSATATLPDARNGQAGTTRLDQGGRDADVAAPPLVDLETTPSSAEPSSTRTLTNAQLAAYVARARGQIAVGDIAGARLLLEPAAAQDDMDALFALAETYDPLMLRRWRVIGPRPDEAMARTLYERAAKRGHAEAAPRLSAQPR